MRGVPLLGNDLDEFTAAGKITCFRQGALHLQHVEIARFAEQVGEPLHFAAQAIAFLVLCDLLE